MLCSHPRVYNKNIAYLDILDESKKKVLEILDLQAQNTLPSAAIITWILHSGQFFNMSSIFPLQKAKLNKHNYK